MNRRTALTRIVALAGGIGAAVAAIPFIRYFVPSERARALGSPVSIDLSDFRAGELRTVIWRGQPVMIFRRTDDQVRNLALSDDRLLDDSDPDDAQPNYVDTGFRSVKPEFLVLLGNCTHLGCVPNPDIEIGRKFLGAWWPGGFHCPCHHSIYDNAGRVVRGPAPTNLRVPPHYFASNEELIVGADAPEA